MERPGGRGQGREKWRIKRNSKNLRIDPEAPNRQIFGEIWFNLRKFKRNIYFH